MSTKSSLIHYRILQTTRQFFTDNAILKAEPQNKIIENLPEIYIILPHIYTISFYSTKRKGGLKIKVSMVMKTTTGKNEGGEER